MVSVANRDMISSSTPLSVVRSTAVWASDIGEWWYCGHKLMLSDKHGEEETREMSEGKVRHDLQSEEDFLTLIEKGFRPKKTAVKTVGDMLALDSHNIRSIRDGVVLADNRSHRFFYGIIKNTPPIVGVPDAIGREKRGYYVVYERKANVRNNIEPFPGQRMQLSAYLMMLETVGITKCFGVVHTSDDRKSPNAMRVYLTNEDRRLVKETAKRIRLVRLGRNKPMATENPNKCVKCQMGPYQRKLCTVSPILPGTAENCAFEEGNS
jgi:CRISPR/Cas system-associated exonuclease Cas4 (RecB family)